MEDTAHSTPSDTTPLPNDVGDPVPAPEPVAPVVIAAAGAAPTGRAVWWEVAAVLAVGVVPNLVSAVASLCRPASGGSPAPYWLDAFQIGGISACTIFATLYLIARSGEPRERFGLARPRLLDLPLGAFLMMLAVVAWKVTPRVPDIGSREPYTFVLPRGFADYAVMVVGDALAAFSEELVTRAYLITRLEVLLRSRGEAVIVSALLFASYHAYQNLPGMTSSLVFGLLYGVAFLVLRRVWPLALGHTLYNIYVEAIAN